MKISRRVLRPLGAAVMLCAMTACAEAPPPERDIQQEEHAMRDLPKPRQDSGVSIEATIAARRSVRSYRPRALRDEEISQLLWAAQGLTDSRRQLRAAPSAGAIYPLETYAVTADGVYRYHPDTHRLEQTATDDRRAGLAAAALGQRCVRLAPFTIVFSAVYERTARRYGGRAEMFVHMEAGHAAQNIHLQAVALGLGSVPVGAFDPQKAAETLGIPAHETVLYLIPVGEPDQ